MCGIAGVVAFRPPAVDPDELQRMCTRMAARGPDGAGEWYSADGSVGLGHRRLAIIDVSERAAQPMASPDGSLVVTFNGEIYNHESLRNRLEGAGFVFRTTSDTEVLLHLYAEKGEAMVHELRGMFAFAIWDAAKGGLFLARDTYGIKPLYYSTGPHGFRFASQVKAILAGGVVPLDPDAAGWAGFYLFGHVPEPFTTLRNISALPAGSTLWVDAQGAREPRNYASLGAIYAAAECSPCSPPAGDRQAYITEALTDSLRHHLVADVPVGLFLSSGIDSGALAGLMRDVVQTDVEAVTLVFEEFKGKGEDEGPLAAAIADQYDLRHRIRVITEREFRADLPLILDAMDQPSIDGINAWFVSKAAREQGLKVAISGLGGDELFGGYASFRQIPRCVRLLSLLTSFGAFRRGAVQLATQLSAWLPGVVGPKSAALFDHGGTYEGAYLVRRGLFMPNELVDVMDPQMWLDGLRRLRPVDHIRAALHPGVRSAFGKVATLEASLYMRNQLLRDADWASMAHSLEVRVPLVDRTLLETLAPALVGTQRTGPKTALAASPSRRLPAAVTDRSKTGFTTPIARWLQCDDRVQRWRNVPKLADPTCRWARRWCYDIAAGS